MDRHWEWTFATVHGWALEKRQDECGATEFLSQSYFSLKFIYFVFIFQHLKNLKIPTKLILWNKINFYMCFTIFFTFLVNNLNPYKIYISHLPTAHHGCLRYKLYQIRCIISASLHNFTAHTLSGRTWRMSYMSACLQHNTVRQISTVYKYR